MSTKNLSSRVWLGVLMLGLLAGAAHADFELQDKDGRTIVLRDDGTWRYKVAKTPAAAPAPVAASAPAVPLVQAELVLERRVEAPGGCSFDLLLINRLPYEIRSLVPDFSVYRGTAGSEVQYLTQLIGFGTVRPGDSHRRSLQFPGIACTDISRLQVHGGDRCEMGELTKFSDSNGQCLAHVRVRPSDLLRFDKGPAK